MKLIDIIKAKGTYIFCPRCGSPAVRHWKPLVEQTEKTRTEVYDIKCFSCGLCGFIEELWYWEDDE